MDSEGRKLLREAQETEGFNNLNIFLHDAGYTVFNIPKLTVWEIVSIYNGRLAQNEEMQRKSKR